MCQIYCVAQSYQSTLSPISAISTQLHHGRLNIRSRDLSKVPSEALKLGILAVKEAQCLCLKPRRGYMKQRGELPPQSDHPRAQRPGGSLPGRILLVSGIKLNGTPKTHV